MAFLEKCKSTNISKIHLLVFMNDITPKYLFFFFFWYLAVVVHYIQVAKKENGHILDSHCMLAIQIKW